MFKEFDFLSPEPSDREGLGGQKFFSFLQFCNPLKGLQKNSNTLAPKTTLISAHFLALPLTWMITTTLYSLRICFCGLVHAHFNVNSCVFAWDKCHFSPIGVLPKLGVDVCWCNWSKERELAAVYKLGTFREGAESVSSGDQQDYILQKFKGINVCEDSVTILFNLFYFPLLNSFFKTICTKQILKHFMKYN